MEIIEHEELPGVWFKVEPEPVPRCYAYRTSQEDSHLCSWSEKLLQVAPAWTRHKGIRNLDKKPDILERWTEKTQAMSGLDFVFAESWYLAAYIEDVAEGAHPIP